MRRPEKVAGLVREEIAQIVGYELEDPRVAAVTVTDVRMSENLREARVYVMLSGTEQEAAAALRALERAAPFVRRQLAMKLNLRRTPFVHFIRDSVEEQATRVAALLSEIEREHAPAATESAERGDVRDEG
ncbi:MAG TPA: 30S ribosome-binding factor RbfA [Pyrinomonadaceae bacterium]|nr:30S ribosome-binding factor RbfA [Pyrinomonadaceae bacterium]